MKYHQLEANVQKKIYIKFMDGIAALPCFSWMMGFIALRLRCFVVAAIFAILSSQSDMAQPPMFALYSSCIILVFVLSSVVPSEAGNRQQIHPGRCNAGRSQATAEAQYSEAFGWLGM